MTPHAGTIHFNPFLGTRGPIENGSKYKKAQLANRCKIIDVGILEQLASGQMVHED